MALDVDCFKYGIANQVFRRNGPSGNAVVEEQCHPLDIAERKGEAAAEMGKVGGEERRFARQASEE